MRCQAPRPPSAIDQPGRLVEGGAGVVDEATRRGRAACSDDRRPGPDRSASGRRRAALRRRPRPSTTMRLTPRPCSWPASHLLSCSCGGVSPAAAIRRSLRTARRSGVVPSVNGATASRNGASSSRTVGMAGRIDRGALDQPRQPDDGVADERRRVGRRRPARRRYRRSGREIRSERIAPSDLHISAQSPPEVQRFRASLETWT